MHFEPAWYFVSVPRAQLVSVLYSTLVSARIAIEIGVLREALNTPLIDIFMRAAAVLALLLTPPGLL